MAKLNAFGTVPEKSLDNIIETEQPNSSATTENFFQKFRTPFDKQKAGQYDFATEKFLVKQTKNKFAYGIFAGVFLFILLFFGIILSYLYRSNDTPSLEKTKITKVKVTKAKVTKAKVNDVKTEADFTSKKENNVSILNLQKHIQTINNYLQKEEYQVALVEAKQINYIFEKKLTKNNNDTQIYPLHIQYNNYLSEIYYRLNNPQEAIFYSDRALRQSLEHYGKYELQTAKQYELMAFSLDNIGDFDKALTLRHNAIHIRLKYDDTKVDEGKLITDMNNLGEEYRTLGHLKESQEILLQAISRVEKKHGIDAPELVVILNNLGLTHQENNDKTIGLAFLQQAYQLAYRHYGNDHELTTIITKNISRLRTLGEKL